MSEQERAAIALARAGLDRLVAEFEEAITPDSFQRIDLSCGNARFHFKLRVCRVSTSPAPIIAGRLPAPKAGGPKIRAAHRRVLSRIPVGQDRRVKADTVLKQLFPKPNSYNRSLVTDLHRAQLISRDDDDGKIYRPA